jgi:hypothetical protein
MTDPIIRANDAKFILNSEVWQEAKANIEGKLQYLRRSVSPTATAAHTNIILMDQLWGDLLGYFEQIAQTGQIAEFHVREAEHKRTLMEQGIAMFRTGGRNTL